MISHVRAALFVLFATTALPAAAAAQNEPTASNAVIHTMRWRDDRAADPPASAALREEHGGPWSAPTMLFTPAGALPQWSVRARVGTEYQTMIRGRDSLRPRMGAELGIGHNITLGLGTRWLGGSADVLEAHSPHFDARLQLFGRADGRGLFGTAGVTVKWRGFSGRAPEFEFRYAMQYRAMAFEGGIEAVFGQAVGIDERDAEARAYAAFHLGSRFAFGAAGQARFDLSPESLTRGLGWDLRGGALASLAIDRYQLGLLAGASNDRLPEGAGVSPFGQFFMAYRFN